MNERPLCAMLFHGLVSVLFEGILSPSSARLAFAPAPFDEAQVFKAVEHGIEHASRQVELAAGTGFDVLHDGVSVALTPLRC